MVSLSVVGGVRVVTRGMGCTGPPESPGDLTTPGLTGGLGQG
jgi:hypothetical protein